MVSRHLSLKKRFSMSLYECFIVIRYCGRMLVSLFSITVKCREIYFCNTR